jgi:hypothetical protein
MTPDAKVMIPVERMVPGKPLLVTETAPPEFQYTGLDEVELILGELMNVMGCLRVIPAGQLKIQRALGSPPPSSVSVPNI